MRLLAAFFIYAHCCREIIYLVTDHKAVENCLVIKLKNLINDESASRILATAG